MKAQAIALLCFGFVACGHAPSEQGATPASVQAVVADEAFGAPSDDVLDAVLPDAEIAGRADGKAIREMPLGRVALILTHTHVPTDLFPRLLAAIAAIEEPFEACGLSPLRDIDEAAFSATRDGSGVLAVRFDVPPVKAMECAKKLVPSAAATHFAGADALELAGRLAVPRGNLVWIGDRASLAKAFRGSRDAAVASKLRPTPDTIFAIIAHADDAKLPVSRLDATMRAGDEASTLDVDAQAATEDLAREYTTRLNEIAAKTRISAKGIIEGVDLKIENHGADVSLHVATKGGPEGQTSFLGALASAGVIGIKQIDGAVQAAYARKTVASIGKAVAAAYDGKKHGFPPSGKPVPKQVPRGFKSALSANDWQAPGWKDIGFSLVEPSPYQYEFVTSLDGKHVTVRARGDLDGDGKESLFELKLTADANGEVETGTLAVKDELE